MTEVLVAIPRVHEATRAGLERLRAAGCELGSIRTAGRLARTS